MSESKLTREQIEAIPAVQCSKWRDCYSVDKDDWEAIKAMALNLASLGAQGQHVQICARCGASTINAAGQIEGTHDAAAPIDAPGYPGPRRCSKGNKCERAAKGGTECMAGQCSNVNHWNESFPAAAPVERQEGGPEDIRARLAELPCAETIGPIVEALHNQSVAVGLHEQAEKRAQAAEQRVRELKVGAERVHKAWKDFMAGVDLHPGSTAEANCRDLDEAIVALLPSPPAQEEGP